MYSFWLSFMIFGLIFAALIWVLQSKKIPRNAKLAAAAVVFLVVIGATLFDTNVFLGAEVWYEKSPYREVILFGLMLLGMLARSLSIAIEERREKIKRMKENGEDSPVVSIQLDYWELFYPTLFSVITFGALLSQLSDQSLSIAAIVLSFQTGFFWQTIIKQRKESFD